MRKIVFLLSFFCIFVFFGKVDAEPIREVNLEYDYEAQVLKINVKHITRDKKDNYVRKVMIFKNAKEAGVEYYNVQPDPVMLSVEHSLPAEEGDQISVKAFASDGGFKEAAITVVKPSSDDKKEEEAKPMPETDDNEQKQETKEPYSY